VNLIPRHLLNDANLDRVIRHVVFLIRVVLIICIFLSAIALTLAPFTRAEPDNIGAFFFFSVFYSIIWGTIPSIFLLTSIRLDNKYRKKARLQPLTSEVKLLVINIAIILILIAMTIIVLRQN
jgi:hypothetical protein